MFILQENNKSNIKKNFINYFKLYLLNIRVLKIIVTNLKKRIDLQKLHMSM